MAFRPGGGPRAVLAWRLEARQGIRCRWSSDLRYTASLPGLGATGGCGTLAWEQRAQGFMGHFSLEGPGWTLLLSVQVRWAEGGMGSMKSGQVKVVPAGAEAG